jgi:NAD(P) transhydrogenase
LYDLVVIGSGPSGQKGAINAAKMGKRVAVVDAPTLLGGVCVHLGTIPSKTFREAVLHYTGYRSRAFYGGTYKQTKISIEDIMDRVQSVASMQAELIRHQLERNGISIIDGKAKFVDSHKVEVLDLEGKLIKVLEAKNFLIAVGTRPVRPPQWAQLFNTNFVVDSDQILSYNFKLPRDMIVIGSGVIGIEYASMMCYLPGTRVTVIDSRKDLLEFVDRDIIGALIYSMRRQGAQFKFNEKVSDIVITNESGRDRVQVQLESGKRVNGDCVLYAVGRQGNTDTLNLDSIGLKPNSRGLIEVDEHFKSAVQHVSAAGDVIGFPALASTSMEQGRLATHYMFNKEDVPPPTNKFLPYGIYTIPAISMVGKTEQELTAQKVPYEIGIAKFEELAKGQMMGAKDGFLKMIFSSQPPHNLLGCSVIGESAAEIIHIAQAVLVLNGTIEYFRDATFNFPTYAEACRIAALDGINRLK